MPVTYICENGHQNTKHKSQPSSGDKARKPVCIECSAEIINRKVPMYECEDCGNRWFYKGDAELPTCSQCRGKSTEPVKAV